MLLGLSLSGLASGDVQLDMESGDDLLKLRDALAEGERLRWRLGSSANVRRDRGASASSSSKVQLDSSYIDV
jgi:hypothetical protein